MRVRYQVFQSSIESWDSLFTQAAEFATQVGRDRLIGISQSEGKGGGFGNNGVVTVWYWDDEG